MNKSRVIRFLVYTCLISTPAFFQAKSTCDRTPKHSARCKPNCKRGLWRTCVSCPTTPTCSSFCKTGVPIRKRRYHQETEDPFPLHKAVRERWPVDRIMRLLDEVNINAVDNERRTALHWAAIYAYPELIELLLIKGADVDIRDYRGNTPLHLVIKLYTPRPADRRKVISQLLYNGASMYDRNFVGNNAFDSAYNSLNQSYALHTSEQS